MDPNETLNLCLEAIQQGDWEAAFYHAIGLKTWLHKGGLGIDRVGNSVDLEVWCQVTMRICQTRAIE